ncbi:MFS transporter [Bacillus cereus]|uniref:MFS transporter n=1 Tax=Bacillus cereus TaxID=1396 RepID=UPI0013975932|nr:MFS transporter [Bacillus wiedmannii]
MWENIQILKKEKSYSNLFLASIVNGIGDWISQIALLSLLIQLTGTGYAVGITLAVKLVPSLFFGPLGGYLADKYNRKTIIIITDIIRGLLALLFLLVDSTNELWIVYITTFALSLCNAVYRPARMSLIPQIVERKNLLNINILEQGLLGIVLIIGALMGGFISELLGINYTFIINSLTFFLAAVLIARADIEVENKNNEIFTKDENENLTDVNIYTYISGSMLLKVMLFIFLLWPIGDGIVNFLVSIYAMKVYNMGDLGVGIYYSALGVGLIVGNFFTKKIANNILLAALLGLILEGVFNVILSQSPSFWFGAIVLAGGTLFGGIGIACNETLIMKNIHSDFQGRVFGILTTIENTVLGLAMLVSAFLIEIISPRTMGLLAGVFFILMGIIITPFLLKLKNSGKINV